MHTAISIARPGGAVGRVGVPQKQTIPGSEPALFRTSWWAAAPRPSARTLRISCPTSSRGRSIPAGLRSDGRPDQVLMAMGDEPAGSDQGHGQAMTRRKKRVLIIGHDWKKSLIRLNNGVKNPALALVTSSSRNRLRILPVLPTCVGSSTRQLQAMKQDLKSFSPYYPF